MLNHEADPHRVARDQVRGHVTANSSFLASVGLQRAMPGRFEGWTGSSHIGRDQSAEGRPGVRERVEASGSCAGTGTGSGRVGRLRRRPPTSGASTQPELLNGRAIFIGDPAAA